MSTWAAGTSGGKTTSFNQNYSFETDISYAVKAGVEALTVGVNGELDLSGSFGFSSLNKSISDLGKSTGIGVKKPGTFLDPPNYAYAVTPYIFGQIKPNGTVDNKNPAPADVQTFGLLRTAFVADPTSTGAGGWWQQAYTNTPDVALNHPSRWVLSSPALTDPIPANCRPIAAGNSQMNCATLAPASRDNPWVSSFHFMRGLFISNASNPGQGPQLGTAKAGDQLSLQARVYNYSLASMPAGARVHARFYMQPWQVNGAKPIGDSKLIGEDILGPIPPFSSDDGAPLNWVLAHTAFDTTDYANQDMTFWVVVWMEDGNGKLVSEIDGHGLKSIPGALKSLAGVEAEDYSNNVGFYNSVFHVFPKESISEPPPGPTTINLGKIDLSARTTVPGQSVEVSVLLSTEDTNARAVTAVFYDGDPEASGKVFGVERAPAVWAEHAYLAKALFRPQSCGVHKLFVVIDKDTPGEMLRRAAPLRVSCRSF
jgi:hypothetical protein